MSFTAPEMLPATIVVHDPSLETEDELDSLSQTSKVLSQSSHSELDSSNTVETTRLLASETLFSNKSKMDYDEDRRKVPKDSENGRLPAEYHEEAELDLHEKQTWLEHDVEALRW